jgi:three-Cys-motif partner protein
LIRAAQIGAQHTELKRSIVESYLESFTRALKPRFKQLWHIDAFAGRVSRTVGLRPARATYLMRRRQSASRRGSAQIAIDVESRLERLIFMDPSPRTAGNSAISPISTRIERS